MSQSSSVPLIMRLRKMLLLLYIVRLCWVGDIGYFLLKLITFNKVKIPKYTSILIRDVSLSELGFFKKLTISFRDTLVDLFYFIVGILFLLLIIRLFIFIYVINWGPIPSLHEWRK